MTLKSPQLMKGASTLFLRIVIVLVGIGVLAAILRFPQTEGRAAHLSLMEVYLDPGVAYGYTASIPFFVALYQAFRVLGYAARNDAFSERSLRAVRTIKHCAMLLIGFSVVGVVYLSVVMRSQDDIAGGVALGVFATLGSSVVAAVAGVFERLLQNGADMKSENDLTV
jgi:Protein of unknown function (DUF2975)